MKDRKMSKVLAILISIAMLTACGKLQAVTADEYLSGNVRQKLKFVQDVVCALPHLKPQLEENTKPDKDGFSPMTINGIVYSEKKEAGEKLLECKKSATLNEKHIGTYRGFKMSIGIALFEHTYYVSLKNKATYHIEIDKDIFGNIQRIDNVLNKIDKLKYLRYTKNSKIIKAPHKHYNYSYNYNVHNQTDT